jgi:transposase
LAITWKRARSYVHSPDPCYLAKLAVIADLHEQVLAADGRLALLYLDEVSLYRQPTLAPAYEVRGPHQPLARWSYQANTLTRVVATLDAQDGRVVSRRASHINVATLVAFYAQLRASYPQAERLYVVQDNWPLHAHPDVLMALEPQVAPWRPQPSRWWPQEPSRAARERWGDWQLPIQLVGLPTYASWTNPIEKLWRKLRQEVLHLHPWADRLVELRAAVDRFLDQFAPGSRDLLRYVGLSPG